MGSTPFFSRIFLGDFQKIPFFTLHLHYLVLYYYCWPGKSPAEKKQQELFMKSAMIGCGIAVLVCWCSFLGAGPVVRVCDGNGSVKVKLSVEYSKPYWNVNQGNSTVKRIFRYDENTRRILPVSGGSWFLELKNSTPNRLVDKSGKIILEYRNGNITLPGSSRAVAVLKNGKLYRGSSCIANFRNGSLPTGLALTIAAQYYLNKELKFTPIEFTPPVKKVSIKVFAIPNNKATTYFYEGDGKSRKVLYTFLNGFVYEGKQAKTDHNAAKYVVSLVKLGGKKKNIPYVMEIFDLKVASAPAFTFVNDSKQALYNNRSRNLAPRIRLSGTGIYVGTSSKTPIACIDRTGTYLYRGAKAEGTPIMKMEGNRYNHWVDMAIWATVLQKEIDAYLQANPDAAKPFPAKKK